MDNTGRSWLTQLKMAAQWHRRLLAGGLAAAAVALAIHAAEPSPPETESLVVASRDLPGGTTLTTGDLEVTDALPANVPGGALSEVDAVVGGVLAGPARAGEPITDIRLVGPALLDGWGDNLVAAPIRLADPDVITMVRPGDVIDVVAAPMDGLGETGVVAEHVPLLAVPVPGDGGSLAEGTLLVVAVTTEQAATLAQAAVTSRLSLTVR